MPESGVVEANFQVDRDHESALVADQSHLPGERRCSSWWRWASRSTASTCRCTTQAETDLRPGWPRRPRSSTSSAAPVRGLSSSRASSSPTCRCSEARRRPRTRRPSSRSPRNTRRGSARTCSSSLGRDDRVLAQAGRVQPADADDRRRSLAACRAEPRRHAFWPSRRRPPRGGDSARAGLAHARRRRQPRRARPRERIKR